MFPILDSWQVAFYRQAGEHARERSRRHGPTGSPLLWSAVREDLIINAAAFLDLRRWLAEQDPESARWSLMGGLTELRMLDLLTWSAAQDGESA